jgi:sporulation protein YlmC with PRC-barrel domain
MAKAHTLVDNFNDNALNTVLWNAYGTSHPDRIREVIGRVEIRPASNTAGSYAGYVSDVTYDLTDSEVRIELVQPLRSADGAHAYLDAEIDNNNQFLIQVEEGQLDCFLVLPDGLGGSEYHRQRRVPYDPVRHRWLRIRSGGPGGDTIYWETSDRKSVV